MNWDSIEHLDQALEATRGRISALRLELHELEDRRRAVRLRILELEDTLRRLEAERQWLMLKEERDLIIEHRMQLRRL